MIHDRSKLKKLLDEPRMALDSTFFHEECRRLGLRSRQGDNYFLNHCQFFASRTVALHRMLMGGVEPTIHYFTSTMPKWDDETWTEKAPLIKKRLDKPKNLPAMFALLDRIVGRLVKRDGVRVLLIDMPRHPRMRSELERIESDYRSQLTELAARYSSSKVRVWKPQAEIDFAPSDFHDVAHLTTDESRRRYQSALCARLADWSREKVEVGDDR
jgi:hypothetical protein